MKIPGTRPGIFKLIRADGMNFTLSLEREAKSSFRCDVSQHWRLGRGALAFSGGFFALSTATRATGTAAGAAAAGLAFARLAAGTFLVHGDFGRNTFDLRLWAGSIDEFGLGCRCRRLSGYRLRLLLCLRLVLPALRLVLPVLRRLDDNDVVAVIVIVILIVIHIVAVAVRTFAIIVLAAVVALEAFLHLRLGAGDDTIIMFGVLEIVLGNHAIAGALGVAGELRVFFGDMLRSTANLHIGAGAVIGPGQRIAALAVEIVVIVISTAAATAAVVIVTTPSTALVLLSWPHRSFT
ncbi:hypothetical protein GGE50_006160 [Rhizobium leguminosarum]|nr:hypothetical protein [Rhizobium leguminosarum]MBB4345982.1 hypothetical protein [Rhizobium leguminosarum]MBB4358499.1 hypothetical protein [Rhizobium leguminosarum]MBB4390618.1 hypothetical protein [Rhizobium leguminosarum]MBB4470500.1 hypothetical protein [Rhizobium leguminosarum]